MRKEDQTVATHSFRTAKEDSAHQARPRLEYRHQEKHPRSLLSQVLQQKEAERMESGKFPNSNSSVIWKMKFKSEVLLQRK